MSALERTQTAVRSTSGFEYVIRSVKRHKRATQVIVASLVLTAVGFGYFKYFAKGSQTISSIAVLPFANATGDPNMEYLSDGIGESIIDSLSQLPGLRVMSRNSVYRYKGRETDARSAGCDLSVQAVLTGRVVR